MVVISTNALPKEPVIMIGLSPDEVKLFKELRALKSGQMIVNKHNDVIQDFKVLTTPYTRRKKKV